MSLSIFQYFVLGILQGIFEWLPVSSSAILDLVLANLFSITDVKALMTISLFLHLGTFFSALIYFWKDIKILTKTLFNYSSSSDSEKKFFNYIFYSTIITGILGFLIWKLIGAFSNSLELTGKVITLAIGILLLLTGVIQIKVKVKGNKKIKDLKTKDGIILGTAQGLALLPGISRSGITISLLLLKKFDGKTALRLSFLMSLPIVLIANIFLNTSAFSFSFPAIIGFLTSFLFGILTISALMKLSQKINFGWFVLLFGILLG